MQREQIVIPICFVGTIEKQQTLEELYNFMRIEDLPHPFSVEFIKKMFEDMSAEEIEEFHMQALNSEQKFAVDHFNRTTVRKPDGRFIVKLPIMEEKGQLGFSFSQALKRLYHLESKFARDEDFAGRYKDFVKEFIDLEHLVPIGNIEHIQNENLPPHKCFYLPHHCVEKESTTTKLRVVFDASAKTTTGISLNELLALGPKLQDDLFYHIARFRTWPVRTWC